MTAICLIHATSGNNGWPDKVISKQIAYEKVTDG